MDASEFEGTQFGSTGPTVEPEWRRPVDEVAELSRAISHNIDLALALLQAKDEIATLRHQLDLAHQNADDLAELVAIPIRVLEGIRPQLGSGVRAAIEQALKQVGGDGREVDEAQYYGGA